MTTVANAAATLKRAVDFAADFAGCTLAFGDGTTTAVTHTVTSWTTANSGQDAVASVDVVDADVEITSTVNPVNQVVVTKGTKTYTLSVGTADADIIVTTTNFIAGQPSNVGAFDMLFPAQ